MTQGVQYVVTLNDPAVIAAFGRMEGSAQSFERSITGINSALAGLGLALGLREIYEFGKGMVQTAADFEVSMLRIKNASANTKDGIRNQLFINDEADKFKLKLQESADAYGSFLFKIKNAGLSPDVTRHLYDNILTISKVSALPQGEIDATVRNIGIMLGEGILEARHLRALSYVHPQLVPFLAHALGMKDNQKDAFSAVLKNEHDDATAMQKISLLMSGGKLTKMAINSNVIIKAIEDYKNSVADKLPETLMTIQSGMNDITRDWLRFQSEVVAKLRPELNELFGTIRGGITWMREHEDTLIRAGTFLANLVKTWVEYKLVIGGLALLQGGISTIFGTQVAGISAQTAATAALNAELTLMNINLETLIALQGEVAATSIWASAGAAEIAAMRAFGLPINVPMATGANVGRTIVGGAAAVGIAWIGLEAMEGLVNALSGKHGDEGYQWKWTDMLTDPTYSRAGRAGQSEANHNVLQKLINEKYFNTHTGLPDNGENLFNLIRFQDEINKKSGIKGFNLINSLVGMNKHGEFNPHTNADLYDKMKGLGYSLPDMFHSSGWPFNTGKGGSGGAGGGIKVVPDKDRVQGQRVITYNILQNGKIVGVEGAKIEMKDGSNFDENAFGERVARIINAVVNDSQLHGND